MAFTEAETILLQQIAEAARRVPRIYRELALASNTNTNHHYIRHTIGSLDRGDILFFVPAIIGEVEEIQYLKFIQPGAPISINNTDTVTYKIQVENHLGQHVNATPDFFPMIPGRVYMMRLNGTGSVVIFNHSATDSLTVTDLVVQNNLNLTKVPKVGNDDLVLATALVALTARVTALENKIKFGTATPEEGLQGEQVGTIYVEVDDYGDGSN